MTPTRSCESCRHYRFTQPEPFSPSDLSNPEVTDEQGKWIEFLARREQKEADQVERDDFTFTYEPWFYVWCARHSTPAPDVIDPRDQREGVYQLADVINEDGHCPDHLPWAADER